MALPLMALASTPPAPVERRSTLSEHASGGSGPSPEVALALVSPPSLDVSGCFAVERLLGSLGQRQLLVAVEC